MNRIELAVIGPGLVGRKHIELIANHPQCRLAGVVALADAQSLAYCAAVGARRFDDIGQALDSTPVDGVIVASPNVFHSAHAQVCIERAVPVLIEKPITATYDEACRLLECIDRRQATVLVGHHRAHSPFIAKARELLADGAIGEVVSVAGSALLYKPADYFEQGPWRRQPGGGPILINLVHEIGILRTLCGEIVEVQAFGSDRRRGFAVEDTVAMNFRFASGALGSFTLSDTCASPRSWEHTSGENPVYPHSPGEDCYHLGGTRGSLSLPTLRLHRFPQGAVASWLTRLSEETIEVTARDPLACQLDHFLDVIRGRARPLVSAFDGLQNLRVCEAISTAMACGRVVATR